LARARDLHGDRGRHTRAYRLVRRRSMAFTVGNTFGNDSLGVLGIRGYFRPVGESDFVDLGIVANWERTDEVEELEIQGARTGLTVTHEVIPISATLGYTFDSNNP